MANILIVDDEAKIRRILALLLRDKKHRVFEAESGEEALERVREQPPDLVLLDLKLPGIDGLETLRRLLDDEKIAADVILMTAFGTISTAVEAMRRGAFDYLTKPFDNDELMILVDRALAMRRLTSEVEDLREDLATRYGFTEIIGISREIRRVFRIMAKVAKVDATVLITGESGTGKELVARAIHRRSQRAEWPFVAVNCSAIPQTLVESEFFGHEKGAFTDAHVSRSGRFEQAEGGTLFLDEAGDLALDAQAKLLRTLQDKTITRIGAEKPQPVDVRVIAATNKHLVEEVKAGRFREDLYWRLNVVHIELPALRDRRSDLPLLFDHFIHQIISELGIPVKGISSDARTRLLDYDWPGNVRELENTFCRALILCDGDEIMVSDLPARVRGEDVDDESLPGTDVIRLPLAEAVAQATERLEKRMILTHLRQHRGSRTETAKSLGVSRKTLFNKIRQYGLSDEDIEDIGA